MKILYLTKRENDKTLKELIKAHRESCDVTVINIAEITDYNHIVDLIESSDKVISW